MRRTLALLAIGCAVRPPPKTLPPPAFAPQAEAAATYGQPVDEPPSPDEAALAGIVESAATAAGQKPPAWDGRLARFARDLAHAIPGDEPPPDRLVDFLSRFHGLVETSPHLMVVDPSRPSEAGRVVREHLADAPGPYRRMGVGTAGRRGVIALSEGHVEIAPLPRELSPGQRAEILARVSPPYGRADVYVQGPDGTVRRSQAPRATIACDGTPGRYQVEITGHDRFGMAVLANFPVWCAVDPPREIRFAPLGPPPRSAAEAEAAIFALVQRDRAAAGLPPLRDDPRLAALSRAHSEDMRDARYLGHVSPSAGGPTDRARRSGLTAALLLENWARAYSAEDIEASLLSSPVHRENILDPRVTHLGVGVALGRAAGRPKLWATQTFARY